MLASPESAAKQAAGFIAKFGCQTGQTDARSAVSPNSGRGARSFSWGLPDEYRAFDKP
jgi:hypothetical protein